MTLHGAASYLVGHDDLVIALTAPLTVTTAPTTISVSSGDAAKIQAALDAAGSGVAVQALLVDAVTTTQVESVALSSASGSNITISERGLDDTTANVFAVGSQLAIVIGAATITRLVRAARDHDTLTQNVRAFGAVGDVVQAAGGMTTSPGAGDTTKTLTLSSGAFAAADVGKAVEVYDALGADLPLRTTIVTVRSTTKAELGIACAVTVSGKTVYYGTDDTRAIQAAIQAAETTVGGEVYFPPGTYYLTASNPPVAQVSARCTGPIKLRGAGRTASVIRQHAENYHWFVFDQSFEVTHLGFHMAPVAGDLFTNSPIRLDYVGYPSTATLGTVCTVRDCEMRYVSIGVYIMGSTPTTTHYVQTVLVENCIITINPARTFDAVSGLHVNPTVFASYCHDVTVRDCWLDANENTGSHVVNNVYGYGDGMFTLENNRLIKGMGLYIHANQYGDCSVIRVIGNYFSQPARAIQYEANESNTTCSQFVIDGNFFDHSQCLDNTVGDINLTDTQASGSVTHLIANLVIRNNYWQSCAGWPIHINGPHMLVATMVTQGNYYAGWATNGTTTDCIVVNTSGTKGTWVIMGDVCDGNSDSHARRYHTYNGTSTNDFSQIIDLGLVELNTASGSAGTANASALRVTPTSGGTANLTTDHTTEGPGSKVVSKWVRWNHGGAVLWVPGFS